MTLANYSISDWLQLAASGACAALLLAAAIEDVRHYRISNRLVGAIIVCFAVLAAAKASWIFLAWSLAAGVFMLLIVSLLFALGLLGGGDTKLAAVMALWTQFVDLPRFALVMTASGGILGLIWMIYRLHRRRNPAPAAALEGPESPEPQRVAEISNRLPYGVAIAIAGLDFFLFSANSPWAGLLSGQ